MKSFTKIIIAVVFLFTLLFSACSPGSKSDPAKATLAYLQALSEKDKTKVINLSCKEWEETAALEVDALLSVQANLNNVQCNLSGSDGDKKFVTCNGTLDLTYNDEIRSIDLGSRIYEMVFDDGQWRVCSYK